MQDKICTVKNKNKEDIYNTTRSQLLLHRYMVAAVGYQPTPDSKETKRLRKKKRQI